MRHFALSAVGRDRPGIVAAVTGVLLDRQLNIEDSQMTILRGHFTMMLVLAAPEDLDREDLERALEQVRSELDLEAIALADLVELSPDAPEPSHIVSVYGADHPGIVHAIAAVVAERGIDITDLNTRLATEEGGEPLYALMMEIAVPQGQSAAELERELLEVARGEGVEAALRELERDVL